MHGSTENLAADRRLSLRHKVKTALRVRTWKSATPEHRAESIDVSLRGIYFATKSALSEGEIVEILLKMPEEVSGEQTTEWRCTGHVVRVEALDPREGKLGVGVQFYCYDVSRPEQPPLPIAARPSWRPMSFADQNKQSGSARADADRTILSRRRKKAHRSVRARRSRQHSAVFLPIDRNALHTKSSQTRINSRIRIGRPDKCVRELRDGPSRLRINEAIEEEAEESVGIRIETDLGVRGIRRAG
jgi:hypothetical protein